MHIFSGTRGLQGDINPIVFIHGTGMDHTVWTLFARYFLRHGRDVLSVDLPGHGKSKGPLLDSIESLSSNLLSYLDSRNINKFSVVGHSMGSLIALEAASTQPERVNSLVMIGTALPMAVSEALLDLAKRNDPGAIDILTFMGYSNNARIGNNKNPGMWMTEGTKRLMQRSGKDVIFKDLMACSNYVDGLEKAKKVSANTLLILGENDYLTPRHRAKDLINNFESVRVKEIKNSGHTMMIENPNLVLDYLSEIL